MARYALTKDQINSLDRDELDSLRISICAEQARLGQVEFMIYARRRDLDRQEHPELFVEPPRQPRARTIANTRNRTTTPANLTAILQAAQAKGIDLTQLLNSSINEH